MVVLFLCLNTEYTMLQSDSCATERIASNAHWMTESGFAFSRWPLKSGFPCLEKKTLYSLEGFSRKQNYHQNQDFHTSWKKLKFRGEGGLSLLATCISSDRVQTSMGKECDWLWKTWKNPGRIILEIFEKLLDFCLLTKVHFGLKGKGRNWSVVFDLSRKNWTFWFCWNKDFLCQHDYQIS